MICKISVEIAGSYREGVLETNLEDILNTIIVSYHKGKWKFMKIGVYEWIGVTHDEEVEIPERNGSNTIDRLSQFFSFIKVRNLKEYVHKFSEI